MKITFPALNRQKLSLYVLLVLALATPVGAVTRSWTGGGPVVGGFRYWSHPDNWSPNGAPQNGDAVSFHENNFSAGSTTTINDLTNLTVQSLTVWYQADFLTQDWTLLGNTLGISDDILLYFTTGQEIYINCGLRLEGNVLVTVDNESELYVNGPVDLNGHDLLLEVFSSSVSLTEYGGVAELSGPISGNGNIHLYPSLSANGGGGGVLRINGTVGNSFLGTVTQHSKPMISGIRGAELVLDKQAGVAVTGPLVIDTNCVTRLARANQIADTAPVRITAGGQLLLDGHANTIGSLYLTNTANATATTRVDTGGAVLSVLGDITAVNNGSFTPTIVGRLDLPSGNHNFLVSGLVYEGLDMQAQVTGSGNFSKSGASALLLQASNSFNSTISILQGTLDVRNNNGLGDTAGSTEIQGGALVLRNVAIGDELLFALGQGTGGELPGSVLTSIGISSWSGQVALYTNLVVTGDMTFTGPISGAGGMGCFGGGTIRLGGTLANTYTGTTLVRCPLLELAKSYDVNAFSGPLIGGGDFGGTAEVRWLNSFQASLQPVTLYPNGLINLNGFDDNFGPINFYGGTISTGSGLLGINGLVTVYPAVASSVINGRIFLSSGFREFYVYFGDNKLSVNATVSGPGHLQKSGGGEMRLTASNSYSGLTFVEEGILSAVDPAALGAGDIQTSVAEGATLNLLFASGVMREIIALRGSGAAFGYGALTVSGNVTLRNQFPSIYPCLSLITNSTIVVNFGAQLVADGFINGQGPLIKTGGGSLVFSNANPNTYTGDTIVTAGTLELRKPNNTIAIPGNLVIGPASTFSPATTRWFQTGGINANSNFTVNANSLLDLNGNNQNLRLLTLNDGADVQTGAGNLNFLSGGLLTVGSLNPSGSQASSSFSGRLGLPANESLVFAVAAYAPGIPVGAPELDLSAQIPAPVENVNFERAGILKTGSGEMRLSGNNTFNGRVDVNVGTLTVASGTALGSTFDGTFVANSASLALINGLSVNNETLFLNSSHSAALDNRGGNNSWSGSITLARASNMSVNQDWSLTLSGAISGAGSLTKVGGGILSLTGSANNTHAGNTLVNEGTLLLGKTYGFQAVPASLVVGQSGGGPAALARYSNHDQVLQNITVNGSGLLDLNGWDEYEGSLTLNGGGSVQTGAGALYVLNGGITVNPGGNNPATISGRLGFDAGTQIINVGSGVTSPGAHDLLISASIFQANPTANVQKTGAGILRLTGTNTYTGTLFVNGGTLWVDGVQPQSPVHLNTGTR
ncbi:MAG: autotransporter-associated beta strand repeat-containing protein, partial [Verrucomicrobiota bacterium]